MNNYQLRQAQTVPFDSIGSNPVSNKSYLNLLDLNQPKI